MKPEQSERILVEELFKKTIKKNLLSDDSIVNVEKLTGDASTRKYYRIWTTKESYVVCLDSPQSEIKEEPTFIKLQRVLNYEKVSVPQIYDKELSTGYILEEDLGDVTFLKDIALADNIFHEMSYYQQAIDLMQSVHNIDVSRYQGEVFTKLAFDTEKLYQEMEFTRKYFLQMYLGVDPQMPGIIDLYKKLNQICYRLSGEKKVLVHRDYHSRNIMIKNGKQVVIDFQDARMGTPVYDLVSLLEDCYYQINNENKENLKRYYYEKYYKNFDNKKYEEFEELYDMMTIQRIYKAIGSFSYIYADRKDLRYIKYIGYSFEKVRSVMFKYPGLANERKFLSSIYYAN